MVEHVVLGHSTLSKNQHGCFRNCDPPRRWFEGRVVRCMAEGQVGGECFAFGASLTPADVNRQHAVDERET